MIKIFLYFQVFLCSTAYCQHNNLYPETFTLFFNNLSVVNPALVPAQGQATIASHFKIRTGAFRKISTYTFIAEAIKRNTNDQVHLGRVSFFNEKEGPYITRPRAYFNYAYQLPFSPTASLSAGLALGVAGLYFSAPSPTAFGSSTLPDGSVGLVFNLQEFNVGISSSQIFNATTSPIQATIKFQRFYNFYSQMMVPINESFHLKGHLLYRLISTRYDDLLFGGTFLYRKAIGFGSIVNIHQGLCLFTNLSIPTGGDGVFISFGYNTPLFFDKVLPANSIEISASYVLGSSKQNIPSALR